VMGTRARRGARRRGAGPGEHALPTAGAGMGVLDALDGGGLLSGGEHAGIDAVEEAASLHGERRRGYS
jgi:hypothetical protein